VKLTSHIKVRTYSGTSDELWLDEWRSPHQVDVPIVDVPQFLANLRSGTITYGEDVLYVDKLHTGFLTWCSSVKASRRAKSAAQWEGASTDVLQTIRDTMSASDYFPQLIGLMGQESGKTTSTIEIRPENIVFFKSIAKTFDDEFLEDVVTIIDPLVTESDRYKQRAGAEVLAGFLRGSKNWSPKGYHNLWSWVTSRLDDIYAHIRPDTITCWEGLFNEQLTDRDYYRIKPLVDWILSLPLEFHSDSAFAMSKTLVLFNVVMDCSWPYLSPLSDKYMHQFLDNANTGYAEIRTHIAQNLATIVMSQWEPCYPSTEALLEACLVKDDPLGIRSSPYLSRISDIVQHLTVWKEQRLPPPRVSQSQYDKVGLTMLQWIWSISHGSQAALMFPYTVQLLPEILRMSELNDSAELQKYSSAVLYVLSAVTPPSGYMDVIVDHFLESIKGSASWRIRVKALPALIVFFYRNIMSISHDVTRKIMDGLLDCLADENIEVREMASKTLSGVVRCSQRGSIIPLKDRFVRLARKTKLPSRKDPTYADALRTLHSAILGLCALIESSPYSVHPWMPPLTEVLADHATDPPPISTTIRKCASEFKKTHQDTWHKDQLAFDEDQLQSLSSMLVGTSYYA